MSFRFGDVLCNHWAGDRNPTKYTIFIRNKGKYIESIDYKGSEVLHYKKDNNLEVVDNVCNLNLKQLKGIYD